MKKSVKRLTGKIIPASPFLQATKALKQNAKDSCLFGNRVRPLTPEEKSVLISNSNRSTNWDQILVSAKFNPENIAGNMFIGHCVLGRFTGTDIQVDTSTHLPSGIYNSTIINSEIGDNCLVHGVGLLSNYVIQENVIVFQTDALIASQICSFGNGLSIPVGIEAGGREIQGYAEMILPVAEVLLSVNASDSAADYTKFMDRYLEDCTLSCGVAREGSIVRNTTKVADTYIGKGVVIDGAILVQNCTLLGTSRTDVTEISHGAYVKDSCMQCGSFVTSMAVVQNSILTEQVTVEKQAKVFNSIIGPHSSIAEGEVTSCLTGPVTGFHHQALLIGAIWPGGKGTVAYGANVGSNHTYRAPDQELWCGEGVFFGLGVNIKYPANLIDAPYSIFATGVDTLPQKLTYPFSLINKPLKHWPDLPPAYNEIFPGWVVSDSLYTIKRKEIQFQQLGGTTRHEITAAVFRPDIMDKIITARNQLAGVKECKSVYTDKDVPGIGKNLLTESNRLKGIDIYNQMIEYYCLNGLSDHILGTGTQKRLKINKKVFETGSSDPLWEHQRKLCLNEEFNKRTITENLQRLIEILEKMARAVEDSKRKDDTRGNRVTPDYDCVHTPAHNDTVVKVVWKETRSKIRDIQTLLKL